MGATPEGTPQPRTPSLSHARLLGWAQEEAQGAGLDGRMREKQESVTWNSPAHPGVALAHKGRRGGGPKTVPDGACLAGEVSLPKASR